MVPSLILSTASLIAGKGTRNHSRGTTGFPKRSAISTLRRTVSKMRWISRSSFPRGRRLGFGLPGQHSLMVERHQQRAAVLLLADAIKPHRVQPLEDVAAGAMARSVAVCLDEALYVLEAGDDPLLARRAHQGRWSTPPTSEPFDAPDRGRLIVVGLFPKACRNANGNSSPSNGRPARADTASSISTAFIDHSIPPEHTESRSAIPTRAKLSCPSVLSHE